jgi:hypothetical protein
MCHSIVENQGGLRLSVFIHPPRQFNISLQLHSLIELLNNMTTTIGLDDILFSLAAVYMLTQKLICIRTYFAPIECPMSCYIYNTSKDLD